MILQIEKTFMKDMENLDKELKGKVLRLSRFIEEMKNIQHLYDCFDVKKLSGYSFYYRIRFSEYRLVFKIMDDRIIFLRCKHRKDIYRYL